METNAVALLQQALLLPPEEREALADALIHSLPSDTDTDAEAIWAGEIQRRAADLDAGRVETVAWVDVQAGLRRKVG